MELYREQGASPIMGFLPMMVQMPIWIALWSAVYTSIDLRGAAFLPFWISDLSVPDALIRWSPITSRCWGGRWNRQRAASADGRGVLSPAEADADPGQCGHESADGPQQKMMMIMIRCCSR
jgi:membrane protein insertase Oxa1/YidC/SpoIIIJ